MPRATGDTILNILHLKRILRCLSYSLRIKTESDMHPLLEFFPIKLRRIKMKEI